ncbi:sigma-70 family RNA polymerase sigma factor [Herbaspirillum sp. WKF16]|uniref:sigma-70 family RNA polymerase sigma factor n=1 Tax=Herbaspirillum sp. WKF16 TaxID=3028312 RepID=UPI0023AA104B|nr:sigma-70 family RNA polymerase sigma factor [Herbaspirillum sp. WKF16]WDZ96228.1 sigma-70 family RNA polymerase sigma factor [Herbaspirillum sp. WKF16]
MTDSTSALSELYRYHHRWLQGLLQRKLGNAFDAADLAHDAFLRLLLKPRAFDSSEGARAYLSTVAKGLCVDLWRRRQVEDAWLQASEAIGYRLEISEEERLEIVEALYQVDAVLGRLSEKAAHAFILVQIHGMTYKEVAREIGVSDRMVKKYMAKAILEFALLEMKQAAALPQ